MAVAILDQLTTVKHWRQSGDQGEWKINPSLNETQMLEVMEKISPHWYDRHAWTKFVFAVSEPLARATINKAIDMAMSRMEKNLDAIDKHPYVKTKSPGIVWMPREGREEEGALIRTSEAPAQWKRFMDHWMRGPAWRDTLLSMTNIQVAYGMCVMCGRTGATVGYPAPSNAGHSFRMWFNGGKPQVSARIQNAIVEFTNNTSRVSFAALSGICHKCRASCQMCDRVADQDFDQEEIDALKNEEMCVRCRGGALHMLQPPKLNLIEMKAYAKRVKGAKGGLTT